MTATAFAYEPALDYFDDVAGTRPQLRLIQGEGLGRPATPPALALHGSVEAYRRRRFLALAALTLVVVLVAQLLGLSLTSLNPAAASPVSVDAAPAVHVVLPGDSYGAIAASFGIANPAVAAIELQAANGGAELVVGQRIVVDLAGFSSAG